MQLQDIGEFGFIRRFAPQFEHLISNADGGIGDDCALLSINNDEYHLVSTDLLVEDIHFLKDKISPEELGYKALAVNLSDIAAMGGQALYSFLSVGIPKDTGVDYLDRFMAGYHQLSQKYKVALMGGDTTRSEDKLIINVAVIGRCHKTEAHLRSMAKSNDLICTTGYLGDSAAGLKILLDKIEVSDTHAQLVAQHHRPEPRLHEGRFLSGQKGLNAMMDISDGIASDLQHILKASGKSACIDLDKIPQSGMMKQVAANNNWNSDVLSTSGGEDYELLLTIESAEFERINREYQNEFGKPLYPIGQINDGHPEICWRKNGVVSTLGENGFDHFTSKKMSD